MTDRGGPNVLLLEDQALIRAGMRALIQVSEPTAAISEAASYDEAVERLDAADPPDVAFLDIDLKGARSGLDVLAHIRARGLSTRPIMLSANGDAAVVINALRMGASGYVLKDMDGEGLFRRALDTVFRGGVFLPAGVFGGADASAASEPTTLEAIGVRGRALEVLYYICQGLPNQLIAQKMGLAESTVANDYNTRLFRQFRVTSRASLIVEVARRGIIPPPPPSRGGNTAV